MRDPAEAGMDFWTAFNNYYRTRQRNGRKLKYAAMWASHEQEKDAICYMVRFFIGEADFNLYLN